MNPDDKTPEEISLNPEITTVEELVLNEDELIAENDNAMESVPAIKAFINASDLGPVIDILVKADNITAEEAVRRLNKMSQRNLLIIVPSFGRSNK